MVGSEGLVLGSVHGFLGVLWGEQGEVGLGVSWRSEVTGGSEVMMGSEVSKGLILGSADGLLGALWGAEGGAGAWGQLGSGVASGVRGHGVNRRHLGPNQHH